VQPPLISVVIPARDSSKYLASCLDSLKLSTVRYECIVVDDGSTDDTPGVAKRAGAVVLSTGRSTGPAHARNIGAQASTCPLLLFIDSDVCVQPTTLARIIEAFEADPELDALIGSYDDQPFERDFLSQYRNLMHHFVHQQARREAQTFWSGCGAIRREVFLSSGGFDESFSRPSIEDIELGYRLRSQNRKIALDRSLQVQHLKEWSFWGLVKTDILYRGIPWTELILRDGRMPNDLNLNISQRISVALVLILGVVAIAASLYHTAAFLAPCLALLYLMLGQYQVEVTVDQRIKGRIVTALLLVALTIASYLANQPWILICCVLWSLLLFWRHHYYSPDLRNRRGISVICVVYFAAALIVILGHFSFEPVKLLFLLLFAALIVLNARFYMVLAGKRGKLFALAAIPFHLLFHLYSGLAFGFGFIRFYVAKLFRRDSRRKDVNSLSADSR